MLQPEQLVGDERAEWYRLTPVQSWPESCAFVRKLDFAPHQAAFDAAFSKEK